VCRYIWYTIVLAHGEAKIQSKARPRITLLAAFATQTLQKVMHILNMKNWLAADQVEKSFNRTTEAQQDSMVAFCWNNRNPDVKTSCVFW